jgi:ribonuclease Z
VVGYSSDTERTASIVALAQGADILVHEATGSYPGHATLRDAAEVAREGKVGQLVIVHVARPPQPMDVTAARSVFPRLEIGGDGQSFEF